MEFHLVGAVVVSLLTLVHIQPRTNALRCYTCSYVATAAGENRACVDDPASGGAQMITNCNKKYCRIQRQELVSPRGYIQSFLRGCEDKPMNEVFDDPTFKTYIRSCNTDLCNSGDGIRSSGLGARPDGGDVSANLLVPGLPGGAGGGGAAAVQLGGRSTRLVIAVAVASAAAVASTSFTQR